MIDAIDTAALRAAVRGRVIEPDDVDYDTARRVWNGMIDRRPAVIVRARDAGDIGPTVAFARTTGMPLAIRGGGHNVAGNGTVDDGIVLDLGSLCEVDVDPRGRLVRVGAGATLADVDRATQPHGLVVPIGVVSATGVAGLTLGGGVGWLLRRHGLTIDNLVSADLVLATGEPVRASAEENADLFWGLRGGGGNFGVVSSFTFRAHSLSPDVLAGTLIYQLPRWAEALKAYADWTAELEDDLTSIVTFMVPPSDWELGDHVLMFVGFAWAGAERARGEAVVGRLQERCPPDVAVREPTTWIAFQSGFDAVLPPGARAYWRNASFDRLDESMIETLIECCGGIRDFGVAADLHHMGGAYGRVPDDATAFPNRDARYWLNIYGYWPDQADDERLTTWVKGTSGAMNAYAMSGQYVNFLGLDGGDPHQKALSVYGPSKVERLISLKRRYDPNNLFRLNHNIPPAS